MFLLTALTVSADSSKLRSSERMSLPMSIAAPYPLTALADHELGLQFLNFCVVQRLYRRWSLGSIGLLPDLGPFCWARPIGRRLACLLGVVDTYGKAIVVGSGLL